MQFIVGRKYKTREGEVLTLVENDGSEIPFRFCDHSWRYEGGRSMPHEESPGDIVSLAEGPDADSPLAVAARRVIDLHDKGCLSPAVGDSVVIEALRKALEDSI